MTTVNISGSSNDTNIVLASNSASINDSGGAVPLTPVPVSLGTYLNDFFWK